MFHGWRGKFSSFEKKSSSRSSSIHFKMVLKKAKKKNGMGNKVDGNAYLKKRVNGMNAMAYDDGGWGKKVIAKE